MQPSSMYGRDFPENVSGKESTCQCWNCKSCEFDPWVEKIPWNRKWEPTPMFLPEESHGQRSLAGYGPWGHKESDTTEHKCTHAACMNQENVNSFLLSCLNCAPSFCHALLKVKEFQCPLWCPRGAHFWNLVHLVALQSHLSDKLKKNYVSCVIWLFLLTVRCRGIILNCSFLHP